MTAVAGSVFIGKRFGASISIVKITGWNYEHSPLHWPVP